MTNPPDDTRAGVTSPDAPRWGAWRHPGAPEGPAPLQAPSDVERDAQAAPGANRVTATPGPLDERLNPTALEVCEVRWLEPRKARPDVKVRRYRRPKDALRYAARLRRRGVRDVGVFVADLGPWYVVVDDDGRQP